MVHYEVNDYIVSPSVVKAGEVSEITAELVGRDYLLPEGETELQIRGVDTYATDLHDRPVEKITGKVENGKLRFSFNFESEQTYVVTIKKELKFAPTPLAKRFRVFALNGDLYDKIPLKCDFHCHTQGSDGHESIEQVVGNLRSCGVDLFAVTDHDKMEPSIQAQEIFGEFEPYITVINGEEVHVPDGYMHMINLFGESVNDAYRENKETADEEVEKIAESLTLPEGVAKKDFAYRIWAANKSKELGGIPLLTHPFWLWDNVYFQNPNTVEALIDQKVFPVMELLNGVSNYYTNMNQIVFYNDMRAKGKNIPIVGSSDSHTTQQEDYRDNIFCYTYVFAESKDRDAVKKAILDGKTVAVMKYPEDKHPTFTGEYRLVRYAEFLYYNYFGKKMPLCHAQGTALGEIYHSEQVKTAVKVFGKMIDEFDARFFNK